jgi:hypothetical protein
MWQNFRQNRRGYVGKWGDVGRVVVGSPYKQHTFTILDYPLHRKHTFDSGFIIPTIPQVDWWGG